MAICIAVIYLKKGVSATDVHSFHLKVLTQSIYVSWTKIAYVSLQNPKWMKS
jgi:hypothetical protein